MGFSMTEQQQPDSAPVQAVDTPVTPEAHEEPQGTTEGQVEQVAETDEQRNQRLLNEREDRARKRNDSIQRRFNELTAEKRELMDLVKKLSDTRTPEAPKATDPEARPSRESFDSYEEFLRADARWEARQEVKQAEQQRTQREMAMRAQQQAAAIARRLEEDVNKAKAALPDYDDVVANLDFEAPPGMVQAILSADSPAMVFHALGKAPDEARRIASLDPISQVKAIAKIEAALSRPAPQVSKAPPPGRPVGTSSSTGEKDPADMSYDEFVKFRRRQIAARR